MSLFDQFSSVRDKRSTALGPAEAFLAIVIVASASDGHVSDAEINIINSTVSRMQLFRSYPSEVLGRMIENQVLILKRYGFKTLLTEAIRTLPYELYNTAFAIATDIALSDGEIAEEEEAILTLLYEALEVPKITANKIIEVMIIKNKG